MTTGKLRRQLLIDGISHGHGSGRTRASRRVSTRCGIRYTHKASLASDVTRLAGRTAREIDCMACVAARYDPWSGWQ